MSFPSAFCSSVTDGPVICCSFILREEPATSNRAAQCDLRPQSSCRYATSYASTQPRTATATQDDWCHSPPAHRTSLDRHLGRHLLRVPTHAPTDQAVQLLGHQPCIFPRAFAAPCDP